MSRVWKVGDDRHDRALLGLVSMHAPTCHQPASLVAGGQCAGNPLAARRSAQPDERAAEHWQIDRLPGALALALLRDMSWARRAAQAVQRRLWQWSFVRWGRAAATALAFRYRLNNP